MSGRKRDRVPSSKIPAAGGRYLPEIVEERKRGNKFHNLYYRAEWPALSDTGTDTSECLEAGEAGSSGSSGSSTFSWADPDDTRTVNEEWEKIQRTLHNEDGPKVTQRRLLEECQQWKSLFPHIRLIGKKCTIHAAEGRPSFSAREEILETHQDRRDDVIVDVHELLDEVKLTKNAPKRDANPFLLQTPSLDTHRLGTSSSIVRSEISSSRWRYKNSVSPEYSSLPHNGNNNKNYSFTSRDNSAASFYSRKKSFDIFENGNDRCPSILEPAESLFIMKNSTFQANGAPSSRLKHTNISLPPLTHDDNSLRKNTSSELRKAERKKYVKNNSLTPLHSVPKVFSDLETRGSAFSLQKTPTRKPNFIRYVKNL